MGAKDPARRGKKKNRSARFTIDNELAQLAEVLAEMQLDNTAYGWFRPPWRDGHWAVALAWYCALAQDDSPIPDEAQIEKLLSGDGSPNTAYEKAGSFYNSIIQPKIDTNRARLMAAALRCFQLKIANSHGGGVVYNEILIPAFLPLEPASVEYEILEWRCRDSTGVSSNLKGDRNDRLRVAFTTAWRRGLYLAAYSLPPAF